MARSQPQGVADRHQNFSIIWEERNLKFVSIDSKLRMSDEEYIRDELDECKDSCAVYPTMFSNMMLFFLVGNDQEKILLEKSKGIGNVSNNDQFELSDEEVMALSQSEIDDEQNSDEESVDAEDLYDDGQNAENDEDEGWGGSRSNYYGADDVEDEEEAKQEQEEAIRLQKKQLGALKDSDFFEEDDLEEWKQSVKEAESSSTVVIREELPEQDMSLLDSTERLNLVKNAYPELLPLADELLSLSEKILEYKEQSTISKAGSVKFTALSSYLGSIQAYFTLFISGIGKPGFTLKEHPVMEGILKAKEVWRLVQELEDRDGESELDEDEMENKLEDYDVQRSSEESENDTDLQHSSRTNRKSVDEDDEFSVPLVQPKFVKKTKVVGVKDSDYGDANVIEDVDLEDKQERKRSLRFYTSKIDQTDMKIRERYSGDIDLPYKERHFERQQRLMQEAEKRGMKSQVEDAADDFDSDNDDGDVANQIREGFERDYYDLVKSTSKRKKEDKKNTHTLAIKAAKEGRLAELEEELGEDGKRAINYQILKNKGLTPRRNKDNRNSRVKKRKRYETAKKKLKSVKQVYKAPTGTYGGEETGIKKNLARSVRFKS